MSKQLGRRPNYPEYNNPAQMMVLPNYQFFIHLMISGAKSSVFKAESLKTTKVIQGVV